LPKSTSPIRKEERLTIDANTGRLLTQEIAAKRLGLFHDLVSKAARIAVLVNPANRSIAELILPWIPQMVGTLLGPQAYSSYMASLQARVVCGQFPLSLRPTASSYD
jgi:hypothetical protein